MPWWSWLLAAVVGLVVLLLLARRHFRAQARGRLVQHLRAAEVQVLAEAESYLVLRGPRGDEGPLFLDRFYQAVAGLRPHTPEGVEAVCEHWVQVVLESTAADAKLALETHGERVLPRLVPPGFFDELPPEAELPHTAVGETGLCVAYVLDLERSVAYLTRGHLEDLGLDRAGVHALALRNLAARTPPEVLRRLCEGDGIHVLKTGDTYDATRLLLLPPHVPEGQARVVAVPDRDSLVVMDVQGEDALRGARELARTPGGDRPLFDRPLRVTRAGIELA